MIYVFFFRAASGVVLVGSAKFHSQARTSVHIIINTANEASETIHSATEALKGIQNDLVESSVGGEISGHLDSTAHKFDVAAENLVKKAANDRRIINKAFKLV